MTSLGYCALFSTSALRSLNELFAALTAEPPIALCCSLRSFADHIGGLRAANLPFGARLQRYADSLADLELLDPTFSHWWIGLLEPNIGLARHIH
jgi:hypothetical protein